MNIGCVNVKFLIILINIVILSIITLSTRANAEEKLKQPNLVFQPETGKFTIHEFKVSPNAKLKVIENQKLLNNKIQNIDPANGILRFEQRFCRPDQKYIKGGCQTCLDGFQDPKNRTQCLKCQAPSTLRWLRTRLDGPPEKLTIYKSPAVPQCVCPKGLREVEGKDGMTLGCKAVCGDINEIWLSDRRICVHKRYVSAKWNGGLKDTDFDQVTDYDEAAFGSDPTKKDTDYDGVSDFYEFLSKSNPNSKDSDGDGLSDSEEYFKYRTSLITADTDGDQLNDAFEIKLGTSPLSSDSDGDGISDYNEINGTKTNPNRADTDNDGLTDCDEIKKNCPKRVGVIWYPSNPLKRDTDNDGLLDLFERQLGSNPRAKDTDADGIPDHDERRLGLNAIHAGPGDKDNDGRPDNDADQDGLSDVEEYKLGTVATMKDTDGDGLSDYEEVKGWGPYNRYITDPKKCDTDEDGLCDYEELKWNAHPRKTDTDGDQLTDFEEVVILRTFANSIDTDGDKLNDYEEVRVHKTNPRKKDTDGDGHDDNKELKILKTKPLIHNAKIDQDNDGLSDEEELVLKTNVNDPHSDKDKLTDGEEVKLYGTNPLSEDTDKDGLNDDFEVSLRYLNPRRADTDGDGFPDGFEYKYVGLKRAYKKDYKTPDARLPKGAHGGRTFAQNVHGELFPNGMKSIKVDNIIQQEIGDCWLLASLAAIVAQKPEFIKSIVQEHDDGSYYVKFYSNTSLKPFWMKVDATFPFELKNYKNPTQMPGTLGHIGFKGRARFAAIRTEKVEKVINGVPVEVDVPVLWPAVIEKALAQYYGSYQKLDGSPQLGRIDPLFGFHWAGFDKLTGLETEANWGLPGPFKAGAFEGHLRAAFGDKKNAAGKYKTTKVIRPMVLSRTYVIGGPGNEICARKLPSGKHRTISTQHVVAVIGRFGDSKLWKYKIYDPWGFHHLMTKTQIDLCFDGSALAKRNLNQTYKDSP